MDAKALASAPLVMRTVTSFISLTAPKIPEPSAPEIQPFLSQIARDSRLPPTPHVGVAFPPEDNSQRSCSRNHNWRSQTALLVLTSLLERGRCHQHNTMKAIAEGINLEEF